MPPSTVLKQTFSNVGDGEVSDELVSSSARKVLLSTEDVKLWLNIWLRWLETKKGEQQKPLQQDEGKRKLINRLIKPPAL